MLLSRSLTTLFIGALPNHSPKDLEEPQVVAYRLSFDSGSQSLYGPSRINRGVSLVLLLHFHFILHSVAVSSKREQCLTLPNAW